MLIGDDGRDVKSNVPCFCCNKKLGNTHEECNYWLETWVKVFVLMVQMGSKGNVSDESCFGLDFFDAIIKRIIIRMRTRTSVQ